MSEAGEIIGRIKLDGLGQFLADLDTAKAATESLGAGDPKIKVTTEGAGKAVAELEAVKVAEDHVEQGQRKIAAAQKDGQKQAVQWQGALIGGLVAVSAAAPPVAAGALAIGGAFGVMAGAGVLGLAGIVRGMKEGNAVGQQYQGTVESLKNSLYSVEDAGARGLFPGVQKSAALLRQDMPELNSEVQHFAGMLGAMLPTGLDAVVTLVERANPLFNAAGGYLQHIVQGLDNWSHGNGYQDFLDYSIKELPQVEHFLGDTAHLVGDFITAWAPLGADTLPALDGIVTGLDDIIKNTGPLVPMVVAVVGAYKLLSPVGGMLSGIVGWTRTLGATSVTTAGEVGTVATAEEGVTTGAAGFGGVALGLTAIAAAAEAAAFWTSKVNYDKTYKDTKGSPAKKAAVAQTAQQASVTAPDSAGGGGNSGVGMAIGAGIDAQWEAEQAASKKTAAQIAADQHAIYVVATNTGAAWRAQVAAVNAAGTAYTTLIARGNALSTAEEKAGKAAQQVEASNEAVASSVDAVSASFKANGASLSQSTTKGLANRAAVLQSVQAIQAQGDALVQSGKSALDARISNDKMAITLEHTMEKFHVSKKAAEDYVNSLLGIPKNVSTEADLKAAQALKHAAAAKKAARDFADGDYTGALKADSKDMKAKVADAQKRAVALARGNYEAFLKANPSNANANSADAARKAHSFAAGAYTANLRADASSANAVIEQVRNEMAAINGTTATVYVAAVAAGVDPSRAGQINRNAGAHGGTAGSSSFGSIPGLAYGGTGGGTVRGPGSAASDQAGTYRLANGEEVTSNLFGQADRWRPMLKAINSGRLRSPADLGGSQPAQVHVHIASKVAGLSLEDIIDVRVFQAQSARDRQDEFAFQLGMQDRMLVAGAPA